MDEMLEEGGAMEFLAIQYQKNAQSKQADLETEADAMMIDLPTGAEVTAKDDMAVIPSPKSGVAATAQASAKDALLLFKKLLKPPATLSVRHILNFQYRHYVVFHTQPPEN